MVTNSSEKWSSSLQVDLDSVVCKATQNVEFLLKYSYSSSLKKSVGLRVISIYEDLEKISEAGRFKKWESSKYFVETLTSRLYTSQDLDKTFIFLIIIVVFMIV